MLIVVEHRDVTSFLQLLLDLEAAGCADVLKIDSAEAARQKANRMYDFIHILAADAQGNRIHITEIFEEDALAFHDRHSSFRADVAQSQNRRAIGHDRNGVPAAGQLITLGRVLLDCQTGSCHTGGVSDRQSFTRAGLCPGVHFQLAAQLAMQLHCFFCVIHARFLLYSSCPLVRITF